MKTCLCRRGARRRSRGGYWIRSALFRVDINQFLVRVASMAFTLHAVEQTEHAVEQAP